MYYCSDTQYFRPAKVWLNHLQGYIVDNPCTQNQTKRGVLLYFVENNMLPISVSDKSSDAFII